MTALIDIQMAFDGDDTIAADIPSPENLQRWADTVFAYLALNDQEFTARFVDRTESRTLNHQYRGKDKPTNVLSFPFESPPGIELPLLGDLVICAPVISEEAEAQNKTVGNHYAHMIVHGILHLLGYDHIDEAEAQQMEALEIRILAELGIDDPYQDDYFDH
ncbi:rRNA maturation RNase YbeY [Salinimonas sp. HHU 13199]|uniref:Endoribonuclease YbeY n=1 Tax=Salinimonas profundi TaxID=2729140 RepID=A0ABR8LLM7_9ALTE|nr:rRNA maturation RNase YbeY [Salinimonas profundi]MBD3584990.1 rRNA maturation RNase YbeY [Salinimonas profundi]